MDDATIQMRNQVVLDHLTSSDYSMRKEGQDKLNDYIRTRAREDGILRAILEPMPVTAAELDPQVGIEAPTKIFEKEPDTPDAVTIPFGGTVEVREPEGDRFLVVFDTIRTYKQRKSKFLLMTYRNDIRNIITDNSLKEILEHEDRRFFAAVDSGLGGAAGTTLSRVGGVALWQNVAGGLTPTTWVDMMQIMPKADSRFEPATVVMNIVTAQEILSWDALDVGNATKEEMFANGLTIGKIFGKRLIITNKRDIVADNEVYMFAEPDKLGKFCVLQDATIFADAEGEMVEWYIMECIGVTLAQISGCAKATITA